MNSTTATTGQPGGQTGWTPAQVTRSLLGWGVVAGPFYVVTSVAQGLSREGFDFTRHQWSLLANGDLGWIQATNFVLAGLMLVAFAVGLGRALARGAGGARGARGAGGAGGAGDRWAGRLVGLFGLSLVAAGLFHADPTLGFPVGTPEGVGEVTTRGTLHFAAAGLGFTAIAAACFVLARRFRAEGDRAMARFSLVTGVAFLGAFLGVASGGGTVVANLLFTAAVVLVFAWIAAVARNRYNALGVLTSSACSASSARSTGMLESPTPVVELNRAVAVGFSEGPEAGLAIADRVAASGQLVTYPHLHAVRGELLARAGRHPEAARAFDEAASLTRNESERALFARRAAAEHRA